MPSSGQKEAHIPVPISQNVQDRGERISLLPGRTGATKKTKEAPQRIEGKREPHDAENREQPPGLREGSERTSPVGHTLTHADATNHYPAFGSGDGNGRDQCHRPFTP